MPDETSREPNQTTIVTSGSDDNRVEIAGHMASIQRLGQDYGEKYVKYCVRRATRFATHL